MKTTFIGCILATTLLGVHAEAPSNASIERLLTLTRAESMTESIYANVEANMRQSMNAMVAGQPITDEQRRVLDAAPRRFAQIMREEFNWATLKPLYIRIYKESFDQDDIDGLNAFYSSKAGQAYVEKMPVAMQKSMLAVQERMTPILAKMGDAMKSAIEEAKLGNGPGASGAKP